MGTCLSTAENGHDVKDAIKNKSEETKLVDLVKPDCTDKETASDKEQLDKKELVDTLEKQVDVKKQRRRLSVAPQHVGDISQKISAEDRRMSALGTDHIPTKDEPKKFVAISKKGYVPYNKNKVNQDTYFCDYKFGGNENARLFGVCDGHGEFGHNVSGLIARKLPKYLQKEDYLSDPKQAMMNAVQRTAETLRKSSINTTFSGSTLVFSLMIGNEIYTGNCGDSRGIIAFKNEDGSLSTFALSTDHKPELPNEHKRIVESGGRVAPLPGPPNEDPGPNRVWLADIDVPGLAMSRSLGDDVAHSVGVSNIPEITQYTVTAKDEFLMYASDGVWEFIPNDEAASIVYQRLPDLRDAALKLVKHAITKWREEEEVIDDITAVIFNIKDSQDSKDNQDGHQRQTNVANSIKPISDSHSNSQSQTQSEQQIQQSQALTNSIASES